MKKMLFLVFLISGVSSTLQANPPVQRAPAVAQVGTQTVQCPKHLEGWPYEVIDIWDCGVPGINVKKVCQKWNSGQISVPANWEYDGVKRYASVNHIVAGHYMAKVANKNYLYCSYSSNRSPSNLTTYIIKKKAPGGKTCTKSGNYSFRCKSKALEQIRQFKR